MTLVLQMIGSHFVAIFPRHVHLVALGLLGYGAFAFVEARYRRVGSSACGT